MNQKIWMKMMINLNNNKKNYKLNNKKIVKHKI